ncbi:VOC family protein [Leucobacter chromiiresistens]
MSISLNPYLNFHGTARDALEFYHSVLGGEIRLMQYDSIPGMMGDPAEAEKIMHGQIDTPDGLTIMAADYPSSMADAPDAAASGHSVCVSGDDADRIRALWEGLSQGAQIREPFETAPWGDTFGMLADRFGVPWMFSLAPQAGADSPS